MIIAIVLRFLFLFRLIFLFQLQLFTVVARMTRTTGIFMVSISFELTVRSCLIFSGIILALLGFCIQVFAIVFRIPVALIVKIFPGLCRILNGLFGVMRLPALLMLPFLVSILQLFDWVLVSFPTADIPTGDTEIMSAKAIRVPPVPCKTESSGGKSSSWAAVRTCAESCSNGSMTRHGVRFLKESKYCRIDPYGSFDKDLRGQALIATTALGSSDEAGSSKRTTHASEKKSKESRRVQCETTGSGKQRGKASTNSPLILLPEAPHAIVPDARKSETLAEGQDLPRHSLRPLEVPAKGERHVFKRMPMERLVRLLQEEYASDSSDSSSDKKREAVLREVYKGSNERVLRWLNDCHAQDAPVVTHGEGGAQVTDQAGAPPHLPTLQPHPHERENPNGSFHPFSSPAWGTTNAGAPPNSASVFERVPFHSCAPPLPDPDAWLSGPPNQAGRGTRRRRGRRNRGRGGPFRTTGIGSFRTSQHR